ncbi:MAG: Sec-independent protein translocase protein TatB [Rhodobacterales bacterium]|nr:Sec-independent protein translocase protein TatB [Rhodobacterales bacterium]
MFDLGFTELLLIGIVALIVVGPKDLPGLFRSVGKFVGKAKGMAREFSSAMSDAADDAGMKDATSGLSNLKNLANPSKMGLDKLKEATDEFTKWTPNDNTGSETKKLAEDRAEAAKKIHAATAKKATQRKATEAAAKVAAQATKDAQSKTGKTAAKSAVKKPAKAAAKVAAKPKAATKP